MSTLTVQIIETLLLNSQSFNQTLVKQYHDVQNVYTNQGTLPVGQSCILYTTTGSNTWFGNSLASDNIKYVRITNTTTGSLAATGSVYISGSFTGSFNQSVLRLNMTADAGGTSAHSLYPGDSFIITRHKGSYDGNAAGIGSVVYKDIFGIKAGSQGGATSYSLRAYGA